ncbi:hypothetical protein BB560_000953 [Smittium megazygosporum]|uniref:Poly A polymerase head domain-containing protein n=1 Tax=Smittium megazygosporum TaxID=133381 RepID=A0A2T9ZIY8_9FUNG|nr:hypothetical protein BB560_000953 [Smittium megazygosporum]
MTGIAKRRKSSDNSAFHLNNKHDIHPNLHKIVLTESEARICDLLESVCNYLKDTKPKVPEIQLRIAGGWVRDKLLGKDSNDIDIAIDKLTGFEMATFVNEYLENIGHKGRTIAKISQNPERSKHLETSTTRIFDRNVDFVNLRSEVYNEASRIPEKIEFGTPLEDALRRDITINSLFYNILSRQVEDFTEMGLSDLDKGIIRTPIDPYLTFRDDPLRVLRAIRFASRFDFKLDSQISHALEKPEINQDFKSKISKERVGIEIYKIISDRNQEKAISMIVELDWFFSIFEPPADVGNEIISLVDPKLAVKITENLTKLTNIEGEDMDIEHIPANLVPLYLSSFTYPFFKFSVVRGHKSPCLASTISRESLKLPFSDIDKSEIILKSYEKVQEVMRRVENENSVSRIELGLLIREIGPQWKLANLFASAVDMISTEFDVNMGIRQYKKFNALVESYGLENAHSFKYIVNGKEVSQLLGIKPGPAIKKHLDKVMQWQLENPDGTKDDCKKYILESLE